MSRLSKLKSCDQNFMKLGHIVKYMYHDVFFEFDDDPYHTVLSGVMVLCL